MESIQQLFHWSPFCNDLWHSYWGMSIPAHGKWMPKQLKFQERTLELQGGWMRYIVWPKLDESLTYLATVNPHSALSLAKFQMTFDF